jgi:hypothetical protein
MSDDTAYDGTPLQAGMMEQQLTGHDPGYSIAGLREMVVVERYFVGSPGNRSRSYVEYACRDIKSGDVIPGCRRLDVMNGLDNGDDNVLHPATKLRVGAPGKFTRQTPANDTDGDRVLVGFVEGSRNRPIILGVLRPNGSTYGAKLIDGERRLTKHQGTTIEIKSDGAYVVTGSDVVKIAGQHVDVEGSAFAHVSSDQEVQLEAPQVKLGANAVQPVIRALDFDANVLVPIGAAAAAFQIALLTAVTPANIIAGLNTFLQAIQTSVGQFSTAVSTKVNVE